jgi:putative aldouronate transport system substrate-binding protein
MKRMYLLLLTLILVFCTVGFAASAETQYTTTLTVEIFDRGNMPAEYGTVDNNRWTRWIQENFGDPNGIKVEYYPIPRSDEITKLNTLMASGDAPNIVFGYNEPQMQNFALQGGLYDLTDLIEEYGDNIKANLDSNYGWVDGKRYAIYANRLARDITAHFIRKDWLDQIGYTLEKNDDGFYHMSVEDLTACLAKFKELDLDNTGLEIFQ